MKAIKLIVLTLDFHKINIVALKEVRFAESSLILEVQSDNDPKPSMPLMKLQKN